MRSPITKIRNFFLDLLFPIECLNCQLEGKYLCEECFAKLKINDAAELDIALANLKTPDLDKVYIAGDYEDKILKELILKYKYSFIRPLGDILAAFLVKFWKEETLKKNITETGSFSATLSPTKLLIIPIPLSKKRLLWRGFNQAEIIARHFYQDLNSEAKQESTLKINYELNLNLIRVKNSVPQASLDEKERLKNIVSAFSWTGENLSGQKIILIDDVVTTGATLNEAAKVLKAAGASAVYGLVLAKG